MQITKEGRKGEDVKRKKGEGRKETKKEIIARGTRSKKTSVGDSSEMWRDLR